MNSQLIKILTSILILSIIATVGIWFFFFKTSSPTTSGDAQNSFLGIPTPNSTTVSTGGEDTNTNQTLTQTSQSASATQKIFKVVDGPIVGAAFVQTLHPTTTSIRYINQENGHVFDLPLDVAGAVPRVISNTTIPGANRALWVEQGKGTVMQYLDDSTIKTVYLGFPANAGQASGTSSPLSQATRVQFLPNNIIDIAVSPDGKSLVYLLKTSSGSDGYTAKFDGTGSKKIFSLPFSQTLVSWPTAGTLLAQTKSAVGVPGVVFSIDAKAGTVVPLISAQGITATADKNFTHIIYQTTQAGATARAGYNRDVKSGTNKNLPFDPFPEQCIWSSLVVSTMYCAAPLQDVAVNYLDFWHQGIAAAGDTIFKFTVNTNIGNILVVPGSIDGGVGTNILEMSLSPDEHYLSYLSKGDRTLWCVRLTQ